MYAARDVIHRSWSIEIIQYLNAGEVQEVGNDEALMHLTYKSSRFCEATVNKLYFTTSLYRLSETAFLSQLVTLYYQLF